MAPGAVPPLAAAAAAAATRVWSRGAARQAPIAGAPPPAPLLPWGAVIICLSCGGVGLVPSLRRSVFTCHCGSAVLPVTPGVFALLARGGGWGAAAAAAHSRRVAPRELVQLLPVIVYEERRMAAKTVAVEVAAADVPHGSGKAPLAAPSDGGFAAQDSAAQESPAAAAAPVPAPVTAAAEEEIDEDKLSCRVCLCEYEAGERLRILPCLHRFHCVCVDEWLQQRSALCPLCNTCIAVVLGDGPAGTAAVAALQPPQPARVSPAATGGGGGAVSAADATVALIMA